MKIATSQVDDLARKLGYRRKQVEITVTKQVTFCDLNWFGGTRSEYTLIALDTGAIFTPNLGISAPWNNPIEGQTFVLEPGYAIARTGVFMGKVSMMTLYVNPDNMPKFLT